MLRRVDADAAQPRPRPLYTRLAIWASFVGLLILFSYGQRLSGGNSSKSPSHVSVYSWSTFTAGLVLYGLWLGIVLGICFDRFDLLALRRPPSWWRALGLAAFVLVATFAWETLYGLVPLPQSPEKEQGITNVPWEPKHAAAFAANFVIFAVIAPIVEELTFRGSGQSLLRFLGSWPSILIVGIAFGLAHGLVEALPVLAALGVGLAWLRDRTNSVVPGMLVHGFFNGVALVAIFVR